MQDTRPVVAVVLCTHQGERYLDEQLGSLLRQTWPLRLLVFDDASSDGTLEILQRRLRPGLDIVHRNPVNLGYVANFAQGIASARRMGFDYIALSDQDDRWHEDRLSTGMQAMLADTSASGNDSMPLLVHADLRAMDADGHLLYGSWIGFRGYRVSRERDLAGILGQNGVMGNTTLMNAALADLALPFPENLHVHDYWLAVLAELFGRRHYVTRPLVDYRLHAGNASNRMARHRGLHRYKAMLSRWCSLDLRLPYLEDSRLGVLRTLLDGDGHRPPVQGHDRELLLGFVDYLQLNRPGWQLFAWLRTHQALKPGWREAARVALALLASRRYCRPGGLPAQNLRR